MERYTGKNSFQYGHAINLYGHAISLRMDTGNTRYGHAYSNMRRCLRNMDMR